jgi:hypothetical protein
LDIRGAIRVNRPVARTHRDPRIRDRALFWLGQSGDPRAYALFEELLAGTR